MIPLPASLILTPGTDLIPHLQGAGPSGPTWVKADGAFCWPHWTLERGLKDGSLTRKRHQEPRLLIVAWPYHMVDVHFTLFLNHSKIHI